MRSNHNLLKLPITIIGALIILGVGASSARADETYSYTGNSYGSCYGTYALQPSMPQSACKANYYISGFFTTTLSLNQLKNLSDYKIPTSDIVAFGFTDHGAINIYSSSGGYGTFEITTNSFGDITSPQGWYVDLDAGELISSSCAEAHCTGASDSSGTAKYGGQTAFENPGVWQAPLQTNTPEMPTACLFTIGLLGIMALSLRSYSS